MSDFIHNFSFHFIFQFNIREKIQSSVCVVLIRANNDMTKDGSEVDTDEENEEGDYTVFECPGLAPVSTSSLPYLTLK